jgi:hypothetical protein
MNQEQRDWHRLFGLILTDFFTGSPFHVDLERDLSLKKQLLDVVILRYAGGVFSERLPDGLEDLATHNLITFKSYQEKLDDWVLKELTGHYVNYRKQVSPSVDELLPESAFRLFAVCARYPQQLAGQLALVQRQPGVYDCQRGTDLIRILVLGQLPRSEHNAMLHLFSASQEQVRYGAEHYRQHSNETSTLLHRLFEQYRKEGVHMPYTMEDFRRDYVKDHLKDLTLEERIAGLSLEPLLALLPVEQRVAGLSSEQLLALLPVEQRVAGLSPEQLLAGLSPEAKEALRKQLQGNQPPAPSK